MACGSLDRRSFGKAAALWMAALALPARAARSRPEKSHVSLAVTGRSALRYLPLTLAEQLGFFRAEGLEIEVGEFADEAASTRAVVSGSADVVCGLYEQTLPLQSRGLPFRAFVLQGRAPQIAMGVSLRHVPGFRSLLDLRGCRIGVAALGSASHMIASLALTRAGLQASEVTFVPSGPGEGVLMALRSGELDAISHVDPLMTQLEQRGAVHIVSDTRTLRGTEAVLGGPMPGACLYASAEFMSRYPATTQALADGVVRALKWLQTASPSDIIRTVPERYMLGDRALYLAALAKVREAMAPDGLFPEEGAHTALRAWRAFGTPGNVGRIDLSRTYTNDFARRAMARFRT